MCGLTGIYDSNGLSGEQRFLESMTSQLEHRGPDGFGHWQDPEAGVALGHRRLAILDLSPAGSQPMHSVCGRYVIAYNGEVYNHMDLRKELADYPFKSTSDTETILAAVSAWGLESALKRFVGMFAIALWDRQEQQLSLVRDRVGIKPLYYAQTGAGWVFGSELKALRAHPHFDSSVDRNALSLYFRHNYIPAPFSIHSGCSKVLPGEIVTLSDSEVRKSRYWQVESVWRHGHALPLACSAREARERLESLLSDAVSQRMLSDVPLGAFLSGGIDSTTVVALMQGISPKPIKSFSIGFGLDEFNEAEHAKAVAAHLGTDHTELYVSPDDLINVIPDLPRCWDEPFADSSQIPTLLLSRLTKNHVTVSLSGDGGDELFCGYDRYFWTEKVWRSLRRIPRWVRGTAAGAAALLPIQAFDLLGSMGKKVSWRLDALRANDCQELYRYFTSHFKRPERLVLGSTEPDTEYSGLNWDDDVWKLMSLYDIMGYLPDDILTKVDRASMAVSLEARVPLLDHRVVEFAAHLPHQFKVRNGQSKWLLRQVLYKHVPRELVERPKMGFGVPIREWLKGPLCEWASDLLSEESIKRDGYLNHAMVSRMWSEYLGGHDHWSYYVWDVLMFQAWLREWEL